jgi:tryptophanyl-tRNA synthetase
VLESLKEQSKKLERRSKVKRILSGIKPSGEVTLGNYLGAMKRWADLSHQPNVEAFYFSPNLHALTVRPEPKELAVNTLADIAWLLAMGIDYKKHLIYVQSLIPEHSELFWILSNSVTFGELSRMTQFKDKSRKLGAEGQLVGLFAYPVLMAADILLYDADEVPTGEDQVQHVELTRDIADRFNKLYGPVFKVPKVTVQDQGARILDLQNPTRKMSKSDGLSNAGCIFLTDSDEAIVTKIKRAVTDTSGQVQAHSDQPAISNLLTIYSLLSGRSVADIARSYQDKGYKDLKDDLAALLVESLSPIRQKFNELMDDRDQLIAIATQGSERAESLAEAKLLQVKAAVGML